MTEQSRKYYVCEWINVSPDEIYLNKQAICVGCERCIGWDDKILILD